MKYIIAFSFTLLLSSCCGLKSTTKNSTATISDTSLKKKEIALALKVDKNNPITPTNTSKNTSEDFVEARPIKVEMFDHSLWNTLLQTNVSNQGHVNYRGFKSDRQRLNDYLNALSKQLPQDDWSKEDQLAYWLNAYNAMTIDLILRNYPIKSIKDINKPWEQRLWKLGNKWYNLNEIEHQILRKMNEPRIHFGIVCASISCPKLQNKAFNAIQLESQLTQATKSFLSDTQHNIISKDQLNLSKIFKWFAKDFKQHGTLIDFLNQYSEIQISRNAKKSYTDYNWNLNE